MKKDIKIKEFLINENIISNKIMLKQDNTLPEEKQIAPEECLKIEMNKEQAMKIAKQFGCDLIELVVQDDLSICIIGEYKKYIYRLKRKEVEQSKKGKTDYKIIRLNITIQENDLNRQMNRLIKYIENKASVKLEIRKGTMPMFRFNISCEKFIEEVIAPKLIAIKVKYSVFKGMNIYTITVN